MKRIFGFSLLMFLAVSLFAQGDYLYVLAPSGLNLRETGSATSAKVTRLPYGAKVNLLGERGDKISVDNLPGNMIKVEYQGKTGFAFSGYMAPFPAPEKDKDLGTYLPNYVEEIRNEGYNVLLEEINRDYGGYYQMEYGLEINNTSFYHMYLIARELYGIPSKLHLPAGKTPGRHTAQNPEKKEMAWSDEMFIQIGKNGEIEEGGYYYRAEATGVSVHIGPGENEHWRISITYIAD